MESLSRSVCGKLRKQRPSLSFSIIMKMFVLSSLGTTIHLNVYYAGLAYTSPTVATALSNFIPSLTFVIAVVLGMEKVKLRSARGQAKVLGTLICIGGSLIFTLWKGAILYRGFRKRPLIHIYNEKYVLLGHAKDEWIKGSALIMISYIAWSAWLILQVVVYKVYPARLSLNAMICFFASLQSSVIALYFDRNPMLWRLEWNVQLLTIVYSGVVISALVYYLQTWCISHKGPVFAAMFSPLLLVIVALFSAVAFAERLHLGSLIGALVIIMGLYCVLWGKRADGQLEGASEDGREEFSANKTLEISINDGPVMNRISSEKN